MKSEKFEKLTKYFSEKTKGKINEHNFKYLCAGFAVVVVLLVVVIVLSIKGCGSSSGTNNTTPESTESGSIEVGTGETISGEVVVNEITDSPLEENAHAEINDMISTYFTAVAAGDIETVRTIEKPLSEMKELTISARSEYIESYDNITVYTKVGPAQDSYMAFVYNEIKFKDVETTAAAIYTFYVKLDEEGKYYIFNGEINEAEEGYFNAIIAQDDVIDLFTRVNVKFQEAIDADPELAKMLSELPDQLNESIGSAVAELNAEETETEESQEEQPVEESTGTKEVQTETVRVIADSVNVRADASETADKLGKLKKGDTVTRIESMDNGWSCIEFEGGKGYVKTEFVTVSSVTYTDGTSETLSGTCTPTTTINVRVSASENADKIGMAQAGEELVLLEILENGWTKIQFEGREAYVKSEFLTY